MSWLTVSFFTNFANTDGGGGEERRLRSSQPTPTPCRRSPSVEDPSNMLMGVARRSQPADVRGDGL